MWPPHAAGAEPLPLSRRQSRLLGGAIALSVMVHAAALQWLPGFHRAAPSASAPEVLQVSFQPAVPAPRPLPAVREQPDTPAPTKTMSRNSAAAARVLTAPAREATPTATPPSTDTPSLATATVPVAQPRAPEPAISPPPIPRLSETRTSPAQPVSSPSYGDNPQPPYPLSAKRRGLEGKVILRVEVLANGTCGRLDVKNGSGHEVLDQAAMEAVASWHFVPARRGGEPFAAWVEIPVTYQLKP